MAWDAALQRIVLFGGAAGPDLFKSARHDTWEWDGENWTQLDEGGPGWRVLFALASDTARKRLVLFGGIGSYHDYGDTWEWDGSEWTLQEESGPPARYGHAMAFDSVRQRVVLFGGGSTKGDVFRDTWEWDGAIWTQVSDVGPAGKYGSSMVFDGKQVVLFGGQDLTVAPSVLTGDTWSWDGRFWTQRQDIGPSPRQFYSMSYDADRSRIVLFGGDIISDYLSDTWELTERPAAGPEG